VTEGNGTNIQFGEQAAGFGEINGHKKSKRSKVDREKEEYGGKRKWRM
jgi:hypothetical protein